MGFKATFTCSECGYSVMSSGGEDRGFYIRVQSILCRDCEEIYDAVIKEIESSDPDRMLDEGEFDDPECPENPQHEIEEWYVTSVEGGLCPKCGTEMELDREGPAMNWD